LSKSLWFSFMGWFMDGGFFICCCPLMWLCDHHSWKSM
jgi:hypothetical protein